MGIIIYSDLYMPTFPESEVPLYRELKKHVDTRFVLQEGDYRLIEPALASVFAPITTTVKNPKRDLAGLAGKNDLFILRFGYKNLVGDVAAALVASKRKLMMLDPAAIDLKHRECVASWVTAKSEWMKQQVQKKFEEISRHICCWHHSFRFGLWSGSEQRRADEVLRPKPKQEVGCSDSCKPSGRKSTKGVNDEYAAIARTVRERCKDYELVVKAHPSDYVAKLPNVPGIIHKHEFHHGAYSWESFAPGIKVIRANEGYDALSCADVVLNVRSSISMEVPFFGTPLPNINRSKYVTNRPSSSNPGVMKDIRMEDLERTLNEGEFEVDPAARKEYALKFCDPYCDGKAYERTAKVALSL